MQGTLNRVKEGSKGTERMQGNMEQSPVRSPGKSEGCKGKGKDAGNTEQSKGMIKGNRQCHVCENDVAGVCGAVFSVMCKGIM